MSGSLEIRRIIRPVDTTKSAVKAPGEVDETREADLESARPANEVFVSLGFKAEINRISDLIQRYPDLVNAQDSQVGIQQKGHQ